MPAHIIKATGAPDGIPYRHMVNAIRKEGDELSKRLGAISAFIETDGFKVLDVLDKHLLTLQREQMQVYLHILTIRLARFDEAAKGVLPAGAGALGQKPLIGGGKLDS
jgi:hypothetical protein